MDLKLKKVYLLKDDLWEISGFYNNSYRRSMPMDTSECTPYVYREKDKVFITKDCNFPRIYIRNDGSLNLVRDVEKADAIFVSSEFINHYFKSEQKICYQAKDLRSIFGLCPAEKDPHGKVAQITAKLMTLPDDEPVFLENYGTYSTIIDDICRKGKYGNTRQWSVLFEPKEDTIDTLSYILHKNTSHKIHPIDDLQKMFLKSEIMAQEDYDQITELLKSNDRENHELGINLMLAYNFEESAVYILFLLSQFGRRILECKMSTSVKFKSLLHFYDLERAELGFNVDALITKLKKLNLLTQKNIDYLYPIFLTELNRRNPLVEIDQYHFKALDPQ